MTAHVGYLRLNHLSPYAGSAGWPDWEQPFLQWAEREGIAIDVVTNADLEDHPELLGPDSPYALYLSVGHDEYWSMGDARHRRGASSPGVATPPSSPATRRCGRCASRSRRRRVPPA